MYNNVPPDLRSGGATAQQTQRRTASWPSVSAPVPLPVPLPSGQWTLQNGHFLEPRNGKVGKEGEWQHGKRGAKKGGFPTVGSKQMTLFPFFHRRQLRRAPLPKTSKVVPSSWLQWAVG